MTNVIKTGVDNFFINEDGSISMIYDPDVNNCFMLKDGKAPKIRIPMDKISIQVGGQIIFKHNNDKYIIDDGYRNKLIMAGYMKLNTDLDPVDNTELKSALMEAFSTLRFSNMSVSSSMITIDNHISGGYNIHLEIEPINKMVDRNIARCELNLPMYPTERGYNKNTSLYFRIYGQKTLSAKTTKTKEELRVIANNMIRAIAGSGKFDWEKVRQITKEDKIYKFVVKEYRTPKVILKWEDDL